MTKPVKIALIMGTRPEIIKLAPLLIALRKDLRFNSCAISTGQHKSMSEQAFLAFAIHPEHELALMTENQTPNSLLSAALSALENVLIKLSPDLVIVQGDTSSALAGALAAFHLQIPVAHVEAGLRTFSMKAPFPEEMNRTLISRLSSLHFCPTKNSADNLRAEGFKEGIHITGNTVVDSCLLIKEKLANKEVGVNRVVEKLVDTNKKILLVTGHRRENFSGPLANLCHTLNRLHDEIEDLIIVFPVHKNPKVQEVVLRELSGTTRIKLLDPLDYPSLLFLIEHSSLIITDSGGIQEEAPTFGTPVIVTRQSTERPEAIDAGIAELCPLDKPEQLFIAAQQRLTGPIIDKPSRENPFGDGNACARIVDILAEEYSSRE